MQRFPTHAVNSLLFTVASCNAPSQAQVAPRVEPVEPTAPAKRSAGDYCQVDDACEAGLQCLNQVCAEPEEDMAWIAGGKFMMGDKRHVSSRPVHEVELPGFWIDIHEVTVGEYDQCLLAGACSQAELYDGRLLGVEAQMCNTGHFLDRRHHPINCLSWYKARAYCLWKGGDLPSEEQWEFAATSRGQSKYPWGDEPPDETRVNAFDPTSLFHDWQMGAPRDFGTVPWGPDGYGDTAPVESFPKGASAQGVHDLIGNVREYTADLWTMGYGEGEPPVDGSYVTRGGCGADWDPSYLKSTSRLGWPPEEGDPTAGFRCIKPGPRANADASK